MAQQAGQLDLIRRRIFYRASHRGTKEMDWMLGKFAVHFVPQMDVESLLEFERFIDISDEELHRKIVGPPEDDRNDEFSELIRIIRRYHGLL